MRMITNSGAATYLKLLMTAFFWGGTFIAGKIAGQEVSPYMAAFLRFAIAAISLALLTKAIEGRLPRVKARQIPLLLLLGGSGVFAYNILFFSGLQRIDAGRASLIIATNPVFISLLSAFFFKERLRPVKALGILVSVSGALVVISHGKPDMIFGGAVGAGELMILGCVASWVCYSITGKAVMKDMSPLAAVFCSSVIGAVMLFFPALMLGSPQAVGAYSPGAWISLAYLGIFGTVLGFLWYYQGIQKIGPMKAGVFINFVPVSALLLSALFLGETITPSLIAGGLLVLGGVFLTNASNLLSKKGTPNH